MVPIAVQDVSTAPLLMLRSAQLPAVDDAQLPAVGARRELDSGGDRAGSRDPETAERWHPSETISPFFNLTVHLQILRI